MTLRTTARNLAFSGMAAGALYGCATTQATTQAARPAASASAAPARVETPTERCQRTQRTRVQNCIIESIATSCQESNAGNEDGFYSCISERLVIPHPETPGEARQYSVTVSFGDEVMSVRAGRAVVMEVGRLEVAQIDERGVAFVYETERIATAAPAERTQVVLVTVRYNFDGTTEGETSQLSGLPVWGLRVQANGDGRATASFETNDPAVLVRPSAPASIDAEDAGQKKK